MIIKIPDLKLNFRPIILPPLPKLYLPKLKLGFKIDLNIKIPSLPLLPELVLPEPPLLPSIPKIDLPDLPPAPKLPKLFGSIEAVLSILKILLKIYCLLQKSILAPERSA
ncbi:MAG: hypothetical protein U9Q66_02975 [Patescibacteria group bacterium]|nr:hypothetical protein [Patescibacteria group bacterium]